jgi:hypothetical protein
MNSDEIYFQLKTDSFCDIIFKNVLSSDQLPSVITSPSLYIVNSEDHTLPGEHWLAIYKIHDKVEFFDSLGNTPDYYNINWLKIIANNALELEINDRIQNYDTNTCGKYCVFYALLRARDWTMEEIVQLFYANDLRKNEEIINKLIN